VTVSVVRPRKSEPDKLTLTRTVQAAPPLAEQQYENATILYLKPGALTSARVDEVQAKIKAAGKGSKILLDLRDSSGGDDRQGLRLANFFVKQGTLATLEGQKFSRQSFIADPAKFLTDAPLAVLVNHGTYGPAELTASAIEGAKRGDVVGEQTFGEGAVQKTFNLPDGAALLLTVADYQGPDGKKIEDQGVTPTVVIAPVLDDAGQEIPAGKTDAPLERALQLLKARNS
jgi:carboxyl-terminal processing protease